MNDRFPAKRWVPTAVAGVLTLLGLMLLCVSLELRLSPPRNGRNEPQTFEIASCLITGLCLLAVAGLYWFQFYALRKPPIRLCQEGVVVRIDGAPALHHLPMIPGFGQIRRAIILAWALLSGQGFRSHTSVATWASVRDAVVRGLPGRKSLSIEAEFVRLDDPTRRLGQVAFPQHLFRDSLDDIAYTVLSTAAESELRRSLPTLEEALREPADEPTDPIPRQTGDPVETMRHLSDRIKRQR